MRQIHLAEVDAAPKLLLKQPSTLEVRKSHDPTHQCAAEASDAINQHADRWPVLII
ncbi:MAG: hypothetical protein H7144_16370 [Burkholderiales bacterium]|nr:hypothetical protein [Phycisphaerae bacterium]